MRGWNPKAAKLNDRPMDTFSGEAGDEMSVPRRKENDTAPKRVACQSPADRTAKQSTTNQERKVFCLWQEKFLWESMKLRKSLAYRFRMRISSSVSWTKSCERPAASPLQAGSTASSSTRSSTERENRRKEGNRMAAFKDKKNGSWYLISPCGSGNA